MIRLDPLADETFGTSTVVTGSLQSETPINSLGKPSCSVPLTTREGQTLILVSCSEGLFIGYRGRPKSIKRVLLLPGITQCSVLPDFGFVLLIVNKVLIACEFV